jgi:hypothetical protein
MSAPDLTRGVRASDDERERTAQLLQSAAAEGRLSPEEAGERLAAASAATYREQLNQLIADLPKHHDPDPSERPVRRPRAAWLLWSAARFAVFATLVMTLWGFWGVRLLLWPLGFMAIALVFRPWRHRHGRWRRLRGWESAAGPGSRS